MVEYCDVSVVIPAYNEAESIAECIARIKKVSLEFEMIVCDDGSTDDTSQIAKVAGALVIEHKRNLGNGAAVKTGACVATRPYIVFMDGDLQHPPEEIPKLLEKLSLHDMAIGSRTRKSKTAAVRNFGNAFLRGVAQMLSGKRIDDMTSGFRAVKRDLFMEFIHLYPMKYSYPSTSTLCFLHEGYSVEFVALDSIQKRESGTSNINPAKDGLRFLKIILRIIMIFNPMKLFLPLSICAFSIGVAVGTMQLLLVGGIQSSAIILTLAGLLFFFNGLVTEMIAILLLSQNFKTWNYKAYIKPSVNDK